MPSDFYGALAEMRRATLAIDDEQRLYAEVCRIAVESGHALMAWIGLVRGGEVVPVAWAGPAQDYTRGLDIRLPDAAAPGEAPDMGPTASAIVEGRPCVCTDSESDPRTERWRTQARQSGVRSSMAHPIRRGGRVVGALNLYFRRAHGCDARLTELVDLMASDLGFALDHIDQLSARAAAEEKARQREGHLANIIDTALDAIIVIDAGFRVVVFNEAAASMFGVPAREALGQPLDRFIPPEHRDAHRLHIARFALDGFSTRRMSGQGEMTGLRASGEVFPVEASISRVGEGADLLMTVMIRDLSQQRQAEEDRLALAAAEASNRAKTAFLSRMSHELRTPLNAVLGFSQLLELDAQEPLSARQRQRVGEVKKAGEYLLQLIEEVLDMSRIESGNMVMETADVDIAALLDSVIEMSLPQALAYHVRLEAAYGMAAGRRVRADPQRLRQVMLNLVSNALKYNHQGGWVRLSVAPDGTGLRISVSDNGIGMTQAQQARLFEPFNRLGREQTGLPGSGIGLVLVREMVALMSGHIDIVSDVDSGTTVSVLLPAAD